ncbi:MAG: acetyltransferase, partial [Microcella sp.]|nr:acetyltransferase [Microcella sp.]
AGEAALREPSEPRGPSAPSVPPQPIVTTTPTPAPTTPPGEEVLAIGDSVMLASVPALQERFPGIAIDAAVSRQMRQAPEILRGLAERGELRPTVVVALGTNGPIEAATLDEVRRILGPERELVLVTTHAPRGWTDEVNSTLAAFADRYRAVELSDWRSAIQSRLDLLAGDQIHPGPTGGKVYAEALEAPLTRLASLPRVADYLPDPLDRG